MEAVQVLRDAGQQSTVVQRITTAEAAPQLVIALADESQLVVPEEGRIAQPYGTYYLRRHPTARVQEVTTASGVDEPLFVPMVAEELTVEKRQVIRGIVRIYTRVETRQEVVDEPQTVSLLAAVTGMPPTEAQTAFAQFRTRVAAEVRSFLAQYKKHAQQQALKAAAVVQEGSTVGSWVTFVVLALTLGVAILVALAGMPSLRTWRAW